MIEHTAIAIPFDTHDVRTQLIGILSIAVTLLASVHIIFTKRDVRAAVAWMGVVWLAPVVGATSYLLFGINRIRRRAIALKRAARYPARDRRASGDMLAPSLPPESQHLTSLAHVVDRLQNHPLLPGNHIVPLENGDQAYPAMLQAIHAAQHTIALCSYIFDNDVIGRRFVDALAAAVARGVRVRVLVDAVGLRYSLHAIDHHLRRFGVITARFLPTRVPWHMSYGNLRTHRKIMVVDGRVGFTGGMNIRAGHVIHANPRSPVQDVHFKIEGPVVRQLQECFAEDWAFTTGEDLSGPQWFPPLPSQGSTYARAIVDGPDEDFERLRWTYLAALTTARTSIRIVTPYFLPDDSLLNALSCAAMRGVSVDIILPEKNNLALVQWASNALRWQVIEHGCRLWLSAPPFDHTKMMVVDNTWVLLGSGNWDPRSLQLNFECNVECYDKDLAERCNGIIAQKMRTAQPYLTRDERHRSTWVRLRDGIVRLLTPYL